MLLADIYRGLKACFTGKQGNVSRCDLPMQLPEAWLRLASLPLSYRMLSKGGYVEVSRE